jgi:DNA mismatch endonuclease (patch repair protein)
VHVRPLPSIRREADIVFPRAKVAVFVDGCFWHGCPEHRTHPRRNAAFWFDKIEMNRLRDVETDSLLGAAGWCSIRVWEHELVAEAADRIVAALAGASAGPREAALDQARRKNKEVERGGRWEESERVREPMFSR